jgi:hypothetical protein
MKNLVGSKRAKVLGEGAITAGRQNLGEKRKRRNGFGVIPLFAFSP